MKNFNKALTIIITILATFEFACLSTPESLAKADEYNVIIKWVIPSDYSLTISYPTGKGEIDFTAVGQNFTGLGADSQTYVANAVYAMNITNSGNIAVYIRGNFTSAGMATGITFFNISQTSTNRRWVYWAVANQTTQQIIASALAIGGHVGYFAWSSGATVAPGTTTKTFKINSAAS
jgi:hypothetical protein